jgi:G6PDH family F420-dependent oxidoreductase
VAELGLFLSGEEHGPRKLLAQARAGEEAGFASILISDHFHPWLDRQGESPFVWSVIAAIGATTKLRVTTGVTCPTVRIHPAIVAHAAATSQLLLDGRFVLGVGTGEALNEHVLGNRWPPVATRLDMLEEAIAVMRELWSGGLVTHHGKHYTVENARIYSLPPAPPRVLVSSFGPESLALAARVGDGLVTTAPDAEAIKSYREQGGRGPAIAAVKLCWDEDEGRARKLAHALWPTECLSGQLNQELPMPAHFRQAASTVTEEMVAEQVACGPDPDRHAESIQKYLDAGFDEVYVNQIGSEWGRFLEFFNREVRPKLNC